MQVTSDCHSVDRSPISEKFALWQYACSRGQVDCDGHGKKITAGAFWMDESKFAGKQV